MANPHGGKTDHWQKQADHFKEARDAAAAVAADPNSTPEEVAEANETVAAMDKNLARLLSKYNVSPTV